VTEDLRLGIIDGLDRMNHFRLAAGLTAFAAQAELDGIRALA